MHQGDVNANAVPLFSKVANDSASSRALEDLRSRYADLQNKFEKQNLELVSQREHTTELTVKLKSTEKSLDTASQELVAERKHVAHRHEITVEELRKQNQILTNSVEDARRASMHHIAREMKPCNV